MSELKPCPFCGWAQIEVYENPNNTLKRYGVEQYKVCCVNCAAQLFRGKRQDAIAAWNRRAE